MNRKGICILVAGAFAGPAVADEPDPFRMSGTLSIGGLHTDTSDTPDASKLNEYRDLSSGLLTTLDVKGRNSRYWLDFFGENLGRDDQYLAARGGMYDVFKYRLYSDALKHNFLFNGVTPYSGAGTANQTATFPSLDKSTWNSLDIGYKRRDDGLMFEWQKSDPWYARVEANQVRWSGSKPGSSSQGTSPGNGFVELSLPVDYKTRNASVEAGYNTRQMHFDVSWLTSKFENDNDSVAWTNGYFGNGTDHTYLAADNRYQRFMANATFRHLPMGTTIAARFTSDELKSSVPLATSVLDGTGGQFTATNPSASSFDGKVRNNTFTLSAMSSPVTALDTHVYFNYRKRDDDSSVVSFTAPDAVESLPFSYRKNNAGFDAYYRLSRENRLGGGYDWLDTTRSGRDDFDQTTDRRLFLEWRNTSIDDLAARLKYTRLERDSSFLHGNDGVSSSDPAFLNRFVSAFDLSGVNQDQWKLTLDYTVMERLDLGFEGIIKTNRYTENTLGRLKDDRREVYLNASYSFPAGARFTVFGDSEEIKYDSQHRIIGDGSLSGAYDPNSPPVAANYNWGGNIKDRNWAIGAAFDWPATEKLVIKASYIYYKTDGLVDLSLEQGVPASVTQPAPIPNWDDSKRTSFTIKAVYKYTKAWSFTGGYAYEKYDYSDSQYDGYQNTIAGSSNQNSYLDSVYSRPHYRANMIYGLVNYHF
ncbi:MAG TPA: MtrB/PioB family outer membrane beta-barrel protein [Usitatibacter sp.]|nr:MtrB/PioB family outer membrane beta-barrel protein [Usitatibacter sp.]